MIVARIIRILLVLISKNDYVGATPGNCKRHGVKVIGLCMIAAIKNKSNNKNCYPVEIYF